MKEDFEYSQVPKRYLHCFNAQCPRSANCLRFQVTFCAGRDIISFPTLNPAYIAGREDECLFFRPNRISRFALGITHLYDNLPHAKAVEIKKILFDHFRRSMYSRIFTKKRLLSPKEQDFIRQVFIQKNIQEEPLFDEYFEKYDWE